jgi:cytochrome bd-type quinol oxidase subunit 2
MGTIFSYAIGANYEQAPVIAVVPGIAVFLLSRVFLWTPPISDADLQQYREEQRSVPLSTRLFVGFAAISFVTVIVTAVSALSYEALGIRFAATAAFKVALVLTIAVPVFGLSVLLYTTVRNQFHTWARTVTLLKPMFACMMIAIFMFPTSIADHTLSHWAHRAS